jgi:hypothetical protein
MRSNDVSTGTEDDDEKRKLKGDNETLTLLLVIVSVLLFFMAVSIHKPLLGWVAVGLFIWALCLYN